MATVTSGPPAGRALPKRGGGDDFLIVNNSGGIYRVDSTDFSVDLLADFPTSWTDIAMLPDGRIFANSFSEIYEIDLGDLTATPVYRLPSLANGLGTDAQGNLYVGYMSRSYIDVLDPDTFLSRDVIELPVGTYSAGDIHVEGDTLVYATSARTLLSLDLDAPAPIDSAYHGLGSLYGLHFNDGLYAMSGDDVYLLDQRTGDTRYVTDLDIFGSVNGAATAPGARLSGDGGPDRIEAVIGDVVVIGRGGRDALIASDYGNQLRGGGGNDRLRGKGGEDVLKGGAGKDALIAKGGNDVLGGGGGRDKMAGGSGRDVLNGGRGDDALNGGAGGDRLDGGAGDDTMRGGGGRNQFRFAKGEDVIVDLSRADRLILDEHLFARNLSADQVVRRYADEDGDGIALQFNRADCLILRGFDDLDALADLLVIA